MLKIKDNVDLKELEKFGFKYSEDENGYYFEKHVRDEHNGYTFFYSIGKDRIIMMDNWSDSYLELDSTIYDLIKADLVEKVEE